MKRLIFAIALLSAPLANGEAQSYNFAGCDNPMRSCHSMGFARTRTLLYYGRMLNEFKMSGHSTFFADGVFQQFSVWRADPPDVVGPPINWDVHTGPFCAYLEPVRDINQGAPPCPADFEWRGFGNNGNFYQPTDWVPNFVDVNVAYAGDRSISTIRLSAVPEPSTYALVAAGLAAVLLARRKRLTRQL